MPDRVTCCRLDALRLRLQLGRVLPERARDGAKRLRVTDGASAEHTQNTARSRPEGGRCRTGHAARDRGYLTLDFDLTHGAPMRAGLLASPRPASARSRGC